MNKRTRQRILSLSEPVAPLLLHCLRLAWLQWRTWIPSDHQVGLDGAPRGVFIWNQFWILIREAIAGDDNYRVEMAGGTPVLLLVESELRIKQNRIDDETYRPRNALNESNVEERQMLLFTGAEEPGIITLGFKTNKVGQLNELDQVLLTFETVDAVFILCRLDGEGGFGEERTDVFETPPGSGGLGTIHAQPPQVRVKSKPITETRIANQAG
ncbi:MAG: hypothetical protein ACKVS9_03390 [Phycisphaerae bacterium]